MSRAQERIVSIYNAKCDNEELGGLANTQGITNKNFHDMLEILLVFDSPYTLTLAGGDTVPKDGAELQPGKYYVDGSFSVNDEPCLFRTISVATESRDRAFVNAVRNRDGQCVMTGHWYPDWIGLEAAHIFPLAHASYWQAHNFGRWMADRPSGSINSVQNGILLRADLHKLFDLFMFSINPDDGHKIVFFHLDAYELSGKCLDQQSLANPARCSDHLLRWHYRQAVLANMRGAGEIILEHDFPPGSDMIGQIVSAPKAAERMEFELFGRLSACT